MNPQTDEKSHVVYAFGATFIEKLDLQLKPADQKWQVVKLNASLRLNSSSIAIQYDENIILICGGVNDKGSKQ
jgi:hypothetical protein